MAEGVGFEPTDLPVCGFQGRQISQEFLNPPNCSAGEWIKIISELRT